MTLLVSSACVRLDARPFCRRNERRGRTKASGETSESYLWIPICGSWRMSGPRGCGREWYTSRTKPRQGGSVFFYARSCFRLYSTAANPLDANALFSGDRVSLQRVPARLNLAVLSFPRSTHFLCCRPPIPGNSAIDDFPPLVSTRL